MPSAGLGDDTTQSPVPVDLLQAQPGGITAVQAGTRAAATSWNAKANEEALRGAAARVDQAWAAFLPRLSVVAKYTRLSFITPPNLGTLIATNASPAYDPATHSYLQPVGTTPTPATAGTPAMPGTGFLGTSNLELGAIPLAFPLVYNDWLLQATISVPISDYFLRIDQTYTAATRSEDAARWDLVTAHATAESNGKVAYYTWLRARGAVLVAVQTLNDQKTHLRDSRNQFAVGNASRADVLRAETAVASAELALEEARNLATLTEKQLQVAIHSPAEEALVPGEDLEGALPPVQGSVQQMIAEAVGARPEVKSADANAASAREQAAADKAGRYPVLSAFADGIYANPNPRIFPQTATWFPSWDVGAQLTWSPNDVLIANGSVADAESRVGAIEANKNVVRDGIEVEVTQAWENVQQADFSIVSSTRELASAEEAVRVQRELFNNGRGTSATLTDAQTDLTRARLDLLNAKADARIARIRLEHALGRDAWGAPR
ncbi:MAG TPA: TolC family protein [Polyangiaceae bacterium]|nr:TolC family protein [Polyangiaceae bacterium]